MWIVPVCDEACKQVGTLNATDVKFPLAWSKSHNNRRTCTYRTKESRLEAAEKETITLLQNMASWFPEEVFKVYQLTQVTSERDFLATFGVFIRDVLPF